MKQRVSVSQMPAVRLAPEDLQPKSTVQVKKAAPARPTARKTTARRTAKASASARTARARR
jgi:hypothetical protein